MRQGLTSREVLVLLVMVAVSGALLLPMLGRAKLSFVRTECRSNLRQIGVALTMYAMDCGGWSPASYGSYSHLGETKQRRFAWGDGAPNQPNLNWQAWMLAKSVYVGESDSDSVTDDLCGDFKAGMDGGWFPYKGTGGEPGMYRGGLGVDESIGDSNGKGRPTALVTGLGLLYSGGYLTQEGGRLLMCPRWPAAMNKRRMGNALDRLFSMDVHEPFWSLRELPCWDSDDADGDGDRTTGRDAVTNGNGIQDLAAMVWGPASGAGANFAKSGGRACDWLVTNYWLRFKRSKYGCIRFSSNVELSIVTDTLLGNFDGVIESYRVRGDEGTGRSHRKGDSGDGGGFITNHDGTYNVLFTTGAVKTFTDASEVVRNVLTATGVGGGSDRKNYTDVGAGSGEQDDESRSQNLFPVYFDPIYQCD